MSRKITTEAINAFMSGVKYNNSNTSVYIWDDNEIRLLLHWNFIAKRNWLNIEIRTAGWFSNTTKERLNWLPWVSIQQKKWEWFLNGNEWDGSWTTITF